MGKVSMELTEVEGSKAAVLAHAMELRADAAYYEKAAKELKLEADEVTKPILVDLGCDSVENETGKLSLSVTERKRVDIPTFKERLLANGVDLDVITAAESAATTTTTSESIRFTGRKVK